MANTTTKSFKSSALEIEFEDDDENTDDANTNTSKKQRDRDYKQNSNNSNYYIVIEQAEKKLKADESEIESNPYVYLRIYPPGVTVTALNGAISEEEKRIRKVTEVVHFSGTDGVRLKYPDASNVSIKPAGEAAKEIYKIVNEQLVFERYEFIIPDYIFRQSNNSIMSTEVISVSGDGATQTLPAKIHGACIVTYESTYAKYKYEPDPISLKDYNPIGETKEELFGGMIFVVLERGRFIHGNAFEVKVEPPPKPVEFLRVYSKIVLDIDGPHEAPTNWPDQITIEPYTFKENKKELDPENSFTDERVHLIITIDSMGNLFYEFFGHYYLDPFTKPLKLIQYMDTLLAVAFGSWTVQFYAKFSEAPGGKLAKSPESFYFDMHNFTWRDVFNMIDKVKLFDTLKSKHYANLLDDSKLDE